MVFQERQYLKVQSTIENSTNKITIDGIKTTSFTPEEAKENIDTFLNIVGKSVITKGMTRIRSEEAI